METDKISTKDELIARKQILDKARTQLKKEFFGIDTVIDRILDTIQTWYLIPEMQERPVIINLWGLTGVGKTDLVKRLSELINFDSKFYRFDLGESSDKSWKIRSTLQELYEYENGYPCIICLDEFQNGFTKNVLGEVERSSSRVIWDLLDNGRFQFSRFSPYMENITRLRRKLRDLDSNKIKVVNGVVTEGARYFLSKTDPDYNLKTQPVEEAKEAEILMVEDRYLSMLRDITFPKFNSKIQIREALQKLDYSGTLTFLDKAVDLGNAPREVNCSQSLIFVLGNLDELYTMAGELSPDINADEFRKMSGKITITHVKHALKNRFRNEQIARLGNNHIIYPALGKNDYERIISAELDKFRYQVLTKHGLSIDFDPSVHEIIYSEGVFPTQGTRPVFTTIQQLIGSQLGNIISHQLLNEIKAGGVCILKKDNSLRVLYQNESRTIHELIIPLNFPLDKLRANKKNDEQAMVAVHESGHAVLAILLKKRIPVSVYSVSADNEMGGFTFLNDDQKLLTRKEVICHLAFLLGGIAAEKLIFGEENVSLGSTNDIYRATSFASLIIKESGMGKIMAAIRSESPYTDSYLHDSSANEEIKELLSNAMQLAEVTLTEHRSFLVELSQLLIEKTNIQKAELKQIISNRGLDSFLKKDFSPLQILQNLNLKKQSELFNEAEICLNYDSPKSPE